MSINVGSSKHITTKVLYNMKQKGEKISMLTAYDFLTARFLDEAGIEVILVGDSLGNVIQGNETTLPVTLDQMIYHTKIVKKAVRDAIVVADMTFMSYQVGVKEAISNCGRVMKETGCDAVKMEGGDYIAETVRRVVEIGIPVMGHLGLTPQSINKFGSYKTRGTEKEEADKIYSDSRILESSGIFALVLEKIPASLGKKISKALKIPTIGIGAGPDCDGQVLVTHDMLGMIEEFKPRFVRRYANTAEGMRDAFRRFKKDVKDKNFPTKDESY
ncbi:MAG: 3-methyl-2-oxobutanoate hydroxymethyltransferase [Ignavibacteriaceae bacterium]|jgi:ketopantoate hydroxymethyltransferase (EC 2.1.2.11)|nr:MAG: 3-methyl-2-oxobutanoate hydroxymethyltransferase [Chlorobiota bacterium]KXK06410.1 MAG: 3-methyl-2-oxobutanoate hydroxymethyltransferase [Chlorobi bacterium OLB4]MBV6399078.1 3-methyl-2-oxobutanoate hydroxymethyltransferase [Ignavibacteria bacterium]MCC6885296.1 3-methyl-2-oxobutanoate hydroxymethyltransferase [Ignavibacteriales bacterium]MCE7953301.1 3-methyl-2-oxobutanoate hydroxymethyltransferase [Chlorobi bacterium CHB7]MDL1887281.1 3-methyl-2-oxobutanoate hydroxymethyltransferase 